MTSILDYPLHIAEDLFPLATGSPTAAEANPKGVTSVPKNVYKGGKQLVDAGEGITGAVDYVVNNAKYAAIWAGLFVLGLVLIVKGLGVSTPRPSKIIPIPVPA